MSSLSHLPAGSILDYWYEKLKGSRYRYPFLLTKCIEILAFRSAGRSQVAPGQFISWPTARPNNVPNKPVASLVIPAYLKRDQDLDNLAALIDSIRNQSRPADHVILVDDSSPRSVPALEGITIRRLPKNGGPARARNVGKTLAKELGSDIIAFTDVDCRLDRHWIETIISAFQQNRDAHVLSGHTRSWESNWLGKYHDLNGTLNGRKFIDSEYLLYGTTANLAITAAVNEQVQFNEKFPHAAGEDIEFCFRTNELGYRIKHIPDMVVQHNYGYSGNPIASWRVFIRQFRKYGMGEQVLLSEIQTYYAWFERTVEIGMSDLHGH